jgi:DNA-binding transcriptional MerR regulator
MAHCKVYYVTVNEGPWAIDDFARVAGTTVRNVRLYQQRGLIPPPARRSRRSLYGPEHLRRLRLVLTLLGRGYPLAAIRELIDAWEANRSLGDVLGFEEALAQPFTPESPRRFTADELQQAFPSDVDGSALMTAIELGVLVVDGDEFIAPVPSLIDVGAELVASGVPLAAVMKASGEIQAASDRLGAAFVRLFLESVWQPFVEAGKPSEGWAQVTEALNTQRAIWPRAVLPALARSIELHVDQAARTIAAEDGRDRESEGSAASG